MATYIIHDGATVINRVVADEVMPVEVGQTMILAVAPWDGFIGQAVDGSGVIAPTPDATTMAEAVEALQTIRDSGLAGITYDFGDGRIIKVRPQDHDIIQLYIDWGELEYMMTDDTIDTVSTADLTTALADGKSQAKVICDAYMTAVKLL